MPELTPQAQALLEAELHPRATSSGMITVSQLAWELAQFEIHYLRGIVTSMWLNDSVRSRRAQAARDRYMASMTRALRDPDYRREISISDDADALSDSAC